jgi:hypothetical protein
MYKLLGSRYLLDSYDVSLLGFSGGILLSYLYKKYKLYIVYRSSQDYRSINLIAEELRKKSPIQVRTTKDNLIKMPIIRGGGGLIQNLLKHYPLFLRVKRSQI